jgi:hypothetical protein
VGGDMKINKTTINPHGLTMKMDLVVKDVANKVRNGKKPNMVDSVEKFYNTKNRKSATRVLEYNMSRPNFREALVDSLIEKNIIGANSTTENVLLEGLEAIDKNGDANHDTRLKFVQEINKIAGVYAPEKKSTLNLNLDLSEEELDDKIKELQEQLF